MIAPFLEWQEGVRSKILSLLLLKNNQLKTIIIPNRYIWEWQTLLLLVTKCSLVWRGEESIVISHCLKWRALGTFFSPSSGGERPFLPMWENVVCEARKIDSHRNTVAVKVPEG